MARFEAVSYDAALEAALDAYRDHMWSEAHRKSVRDNPRHSFRAYRHAAAEAERDRAACFAACDMISAIYGASVEKVLDDLEKLLARDNELVFV